MTSGRRVAAATGIAVGGVVAVEDAGKNRAIAMTEVLGIVVPVIVVPVIVVAVVLVVVIRSGTIGNAS